MGTGFNSSELFALSEKMFTYSNKAEQAYNYIKANKITYEQDSELDS